MDIDTIIDAVLCGTAGYMFTHGGLTTDKTILFIVCVIVFIRYLCAIMLANHIDRLLDTTMKVAKETQDILKIANSRNSELQEKIRIYEEKEG